MKIAAAAALIAAASIAACSSGSSSSPKKEIDADASVPQPQTSSSTSPDAPPATTTPTPPRPTPRGTLAGASEEAIADTACKTPGGTTVTLAGAAGTSGPIAATRAVGTRRAMQLTDAQGVLLVDADGTNSTAAPLTPGAGGNLVASEGTNLGIAYGAGFSISYARYDAQGQSLGSFELAGGQLAFGLSTAASSGRALAVWLGNDVVRARGVENGAAAGAAPIDIATVAGTSFFASAVAPDGAGGFGVVWSGAAGPLAYELGFARATTTSASAPVTVLATPDPVAITQIAKTPNGYALLYAEPSRVSLAFIDNDGKPLVAPRVITGATLGWGLAVNGTALGVVARKEKTVAFRPFSTDGQVAGDWVCLEGPSDDPDQRAALDADGSGFAIVYRAPSKEQKLVRFDALGTGP